MFDLAQCSDVGSIPIARSITHDDSIGLAHLNCLNLAEKWPFLDPSWTPAGSIGPQRFVEQGGQSGGLVTRLARSSVRHLSAHLHARPAERSHYPSPTESQMILCASPKGSFRVILAGSMRNPSGVV